MKIVIGSDHAAFKMKEAIKKHLISKKHQVIDVGPVSEDPVDYPDYGFMVAKNIATKKAQFGIAICGSGIGINIACNKITGARAALVYEEETTRLSRIHNDANIFCTGARMIAIDKAISLVDIFLSTKTSTEARHVKRIKKLNIKVS